MAAIQQALALLPREPFQRSRGAADRIREVLRQRATERIGVLGHQRCEHQLVTQASRSGVGAGILGAATVNCCCGPRPTGATPAGAEGTRLGSCSARMYATSDQMPWSSYWSAKDGMPVKLRPFLMIQNSCASLFSTAS